MNPTDCATDFSGSIALRVHFLIFSSHVLCLQCAALVHNNHEALNTNATAIPQRRPLTKIEE